jgi:hypothetical protein
MQQYPRGSDEKKRREKDRRARHGVGNDASKAVEQGIGAHSLHAAAAKDDARADIVRIQLDQELRFEGKSEEYPFRPSRRP